jgi:hypothetical protein
MEVNGQFHASAALTLGKEPSVPIGCETEWTQEAVWTLHNEEKFLPLPGIEPRSSSP